MSGPFTFNIRGAQALNARLNQLSREVATKVGQTAVRAGGRQLLKAVKAEAPIGPDAEGSKRKRKRKSGKVVDETHRKITNNLKLTKIRSPNDGVVTIALHAGAAYHASMVEFGSIHNAPNPFMQRGLMAGEQQAMDAIGKALNRALTKRGV